MAKKKKPIVVSLTLLIQKEVEAPNEDALEKKITSIVADLEKQGWCANIENADEAEDDSEV